MMHVVLLVDPGAGRAFSRRYASNFVQIGWLFTLKPIQPDLGKLNPVRRASSGSSTPRTRSRRSSTCSSSRLRDRARRRCGIVAAGSSGSRRCRRSSSTRCDVAGRRHHLRGRGALAVLLLILGIDRLDLPAWQYKRDQRMTKQEVKDERRSMEGDVETKRQRSRMYAEIIGNQIQGGRPRRT
jgi:flagellar biosynthetic protein FlhB